MGQAKKTAGKWIPNGTRGANYTVSLLKKATRKASVNPLVIAQRDDLVRNLPAQNKLAEAQAIFDFADRAIRYTDDPSFAETFKTPVFVITEYQGAGRRVAADCATQSALVAALAASLDIPVRFVTIGEMRPRREFLHIYPELFVNGKWIPADVTATTAKSAAIRQAAGLGFRQNAELERRYLV